MPRPTHRLKLFTTEDRRRANRLLKKRQAAVAFGHGVSSDDEDEIAELFAASLWKYDQMARFLTDARKKVKGVLIKLEEVERIEYRLSTDEQHLTGE